MIFLKLFKSDALVAAFCRMALAYVGRTIYLIHECILINLIVYLCLNSTNDDLIGSRNHLQSSLRTQKMFHSGIFQLSDQFSSQ